MSRVIATYNNAIQVVAPGTEQVSVSDGFELGDSPTAGPWNNEPSDHSLVSERVCDALIEDSWGGGKATSVTEGTEPHSPSKSLQFYYDEDEYTEEDTWYPGNTWRNFSGKSEVYVGMYIKLSSPWDEHVTQHDSPKLLFILDDDTGGGGDPLYIRRGDDDEIDGSLQNSGLPPNRMLPQNVGTVTTEPGSWAKVEVLAVMNSEWLTDINEDGTADGEFHLWVDGTKVCQYTDLWFSEDTAPKWDAVNLNPLWGGTGDDLAWDQWLWVDHIRLTGKA